MRKTRVNYCSLIRQCILCQNNTNNPSGFCSDCYSDLPWLGVHCSICALPLPAQNNSLLCASCIQTPPSFEKVYALFDYQFPINALISRIKYGRKPQYIGHLARVAAEYYNAEFSDLCIVPVPMHPFSLFRRGYNQAELLAIELSRRLNLPIAPKLLKKTKRTPRQITLHRSERLKNQRNAFQCKSTQYKHVLLIDDVMTTGATVEAASRALKRSGVQTVEILVLARTDK